MWGRTERASKDASQVEQRLVSNVRVRPAGCAGDKLVDVIHSPEVATFM